MKQHLALFALVAACVSPAEAQNRRPPRRPRVTAPARPTPAPTPAPAPAPTPAPAVDTRPRDPRLVVQRSAGTWERACVATRGCTAPVAIPRCPQPAPNVRLAAPQTFAQVVDERMRLSGQVVRVRARISTSAPCTEMGCPQGECCNTCNGRMALTGTATTSVRALNLGRDEAAFACDGDDSGLCCGTAIPTGDVIATGTLRPLPDSGGEWYLEAPTLCTE